MSFLFTGLPYISVYNNNNNNNIIIFIIITFVITFSKGIYSYKINHISRVYSLAAIVWLQYFKSVLLLLLLYLLSLFLRVFTIIKYTTFLGYIVLQLLCGYIILHVVHLLLLLSGQLAYRHHPEVY